MYKAAKFFKQNKYAFSTTRQERGKNVPMPLKATAKNLHVVTDCNNIQSNIGLPTIPSDSRIG